jgi:hypothetical protein
MKFYIKALNMTKRLITILMLLGLVAGCTNIGEAVAKNYDLNTFKAKTPVTEIFPIRDRIPQKEKCKDTDGGINYREAGKVVLSNFLGMNVIKKDKCWSNNKILQEYVCLNGDYKGDHTFDCTKLGDNYVCDGGACRSECVPQECSDLELECGTFDDGCGGTIACGCDNENICVDAFCEIKCTDSDFTDNDHPTLEYHNIYVKGTVMGLNLRDQVVTRVDSCNDEGVVGEYYCNKVTNRVGITGYNCPGDSICIDGACTTDSFFCLDSDNNNFLEWGNISGIDENGQEFIDYDMCISENMLIERLCENNIGIGANVECENGCLNGKCLSEEEDFPECIELIPDSNVNDENKINIVFVGHSFEDLNQLTELSLELIDYGGTNSVLGFLGVEPFKSNKDSFNFWYVDESYDLYRHDHFCPYTFTNLEDACPLNNQFVVNLCNYESSTAGRSSGNEIAMSVQSSSIGIINHELGGHSIGKLSDVYPNSHAQPNAAQSIEEAQEWWGEQIGNGCGEPGVVDCEFNCVESGECTLEDYLTEVSYVVTDPQMCFDDNQPIPGCIISARSYTLYYNDQGLVRYHIDQIGLKAKISEDCIDSGDYCTYFDSNGNNIMCHDGNLNISENCEDKFNFNPYGINPPPEIGYKIISRGQVVRPHLNSIMVDAKATSYGGVNEREICEQIERITGSVDGYCMNFED